MCDTLSSSAANQGDNTVLVAQGGTALLALPSSCCHWTRYLKEYPGWRLMRTEYRTYFHMLYDENLKKKKYIYIYIYFFFFQFSSYNV